MSKHTPGPWSLGEWTDNIVYDAAGVLITAVESDDRGLSESRANARLIAAAPELLEALKEFVSEIDEAAAKSGDDPTAHSWFYAKARVVLAKAEGK